MSPRIIQLPLSGRDRRFYVAELKRGEAEHRHLVRRLADARAVADDHLQTVHRLECAEWNTRQFIGGDASPSPTIADAIDGGYELIDIECRRCGHKQTADLSQVVWPRTAEVHSLARAFFCEPCFKDVKRKIRPNLVELRARERPVPPASAARKNRRG